MTSIAPSKPERDQHRARIPADPVIWLYPSHGTAASQPPPDCLSGLPWPRWTPGSGLHPGRIGHALTEFRSAYPGQPLLLLSPGILLLAADAHKLERIARERNGPVVLTVLSNAHEQLNPFAGLSSPQLPSGADAVDGAALERMAGLVNLLGSGLLHPLDQWPEHVLLFSATAVDTLASDDVTAEIARARLRELGGELLISDSLFAAASGRPLSSLTALAPHEQRRPAPWGDLTARLDRYLMVGGPLPDYPPASQQTTSLHITHSWGGGVAQWIESFIAADQGGRNLQLRSEGPQSGAGAGQRLGLYAGSGVSAPIASWWLNPAIRSSSTGHPQYCEILHAIQARHGVGRIIVSSLVGHSLDALRTGLPTLEVLHDFFPAWPLLGVHPQAWIGAEPGLRLQQALKEHELLPDFRDHDAVGWNQMAENWRTTVLQNGVKLIAPSQSVATLLRQLDHGWDPVPIDIVHHGLVPLPVDGPIAPRARADGKLRLVIPGRMQEGKGQSLLLSALPELTRHAQIYLLGAGKNGEAFFGKAGVDVVLQYRREDLPELMRTIGPDVAALLSVVPETFSYTLSEMRQLGLPVIATRVGSLAERVRHEHDGWLIDPSAEALVEAVRRIAAQRSLLETVRANLGKAEHYTTASMVRRYTDICPALAADPDLSQPAGLMDVQCAALAQQNAELERAQVQLHQQAHELQAEVERRTEWARERDHALSEEQERRQRWVSRLEDEIQSGQRALAEVLDQHSQVLTSTSWRITRPLRVARRMLENLAQARAWDPRRWPLLISQAARILRIRGWRGALLRFQQPAQYGRAPSAVFPHDIDPIGDPEPPRTMPRSSSPDISIVIPVYNQWAHTAACLRSIARASNQASYEVLVVDDHSLDETAERLQDVEGLTVMRNRKNTGFIGSCNRGAELARGSYILLLNNDTQVLDGWLDALLDTFRRFPDTGLAGARLVYPNGNLQEAGGMVFNDGSGWNYGRGDKADRPEYAFTREVDYCSGACVMLPTELFRQLGCLDTHYAPAYYEDTDLAFKVRKSGFKVRVQGAATVIHHEGITSGTDLHSGAKRYQEVNRKKFFLRWQAELAHYPPPIADPTNARSIRQARDHRLKGRVLFIDASTPEPDQDSGSLRLCNLFDCFTQLGYGVTFFADNRSYAGNYTSELQKSGVEVLYKPWIDSLQEFFCQRGADFDFIVISRHYVAANYIALVRKHCPRARFIFDTVDLHYLREERLAELENSLPLKRIAAKTRRSELAVIRQADATLVVSPVEQSVLAGDAPGAKVHILSNIHRVTGSKASFAERKDIFFVGGYQHPPNVDAAQWFVGSIWPLIRAELPDIRFHLIGSKAPDKVRALQGNGVEFHGFVRRLEPWLDGCRLAIAPLRYGAGVKGKVNLSMSHGQPVVATPMAIEGLFARDGEEVLVAESAEDFAAAVVRLYRDETLWNRLSGGGLENVRRHFSIERARENLAAILHSLESP